MRTRNLIGVLAAGLLATGCQSPASPTPASTALRIVPAIDALKVGTSETLTAQVSSGSGGGETVVATWSSDAPSIATVSEDGRVTAIGLGRATIHVTYQTMSTGLAILVVPDFSGTWSGKYHVVGCARTSGEGPGICDEEIAGGGSHWLMRVVLTQDAANVSGALDFYYNTGRGIVETGPVNGSVDGSGALVLSGTSFTTDPSEPRQSSLAGWHTQLSLDGTAMIGGFERDRSFTNFWGPQKYKIQCELPGLTRSQ